MLLRSSSTPVLGSLLPSFSESPNHHEVKPSTNLHHHSHATKLSIHQSGPLNHATFSANSSPIDHDRFSSNKGFRRAQSDGNLADLLAHDNVSEDRLSRDLHFPNSNAFARRPRCLMLESIPSFSNYNSNGGFAEDGEEEEESNFEDRVKSSNVITRDVKLKDGDRKVENGTGTEARGLSLEKLLGFEGGAGGRGGGEFNSLGGGSGDGGDNRGVEEYYRRMVEENPGNSLFLGNYAQFLYQSKGDLKGAEEYYSRAILADPNDGTVLSQYAKLVWESHRDPDRATSYFERAVQASPEDSHVQAAYAHFLWDEDDDGDDETEAEGLHALPTGFMASVTI